MTGAVPNRVQEEWGPDSGGRIKNAMCKKPFLIGCRSRKLAVPIPAPNPPPGVAAVQAHSHEWTVYFRPYENEDFSPWIKKVQFKLHDSIPNCLRTITAPPYEVRETGWGEFEVAVKIFFQDPNERQIGLYTWVRLFKKITPEHKEPEHNLMVNKDGFLIAEYYDELVFNEPSMMLLSLLNQNRKLAGYVKPEIDYEKQKKDVLQRIRTGRERVTPEIQAISAQYETYKTAYADLMAILRGDSQSRNFLPSEAPSAGGSEYGGSGATNSQDSSQEQSGME